MIEDAHGSIVLHSNSICIIWEENVCNYLNIDANVDEIFLYKTKERND